MSNRSRIELLCNYVINSVLTDNLLLLSRNYFHEFFILFSKQLLVPYCVHSIRVMEIYSKACLQHTGEVRITSSIEI